MKITVFTRLNIALAASTLGLTACLAPKPDGPDPTDIEFYTSGQTIVTLAGSRDRDPHIPDRYLDQLRQRERDIVRALQQSDPGKYIVTTYSVKLNGKHLWKRVGKRSYLLEGNAGDAETIDKGQLPLVWSLVTKVGTPLDRYGFTDKVLCKEARLPVESRDYLDINPRQRTYILREKSGRSITAAGGLPASPRQVKAGADGKHRMQQIGVSAQSLIATTIRVYKRGSRMDVCGVADLAKDEAVKDYFHFEIDEQCLATRNMNIAGIDGMVTYMERNESRKGCSTETAWSIQELPEDVSLSAMPRLLSDDGQAASEDMQQMALESLEFKVGQRALELSGDKLSLGITIPKQGFDLDAVVTVGGSCVELGGRPQAKDFIDMPGDNGNGTDKKIIPIYYNSPVGFWLLDTDRSWVDLIVSSKREDGERIYSGVLEKLLDSNGVNTQNRIVGVVTQADLVTRHVSSCLVPASDMPSTEDLTADLLPAFSKQKDLDGRTLQDQLTSIANLLRSTPGMNSSNFSNATVTAMISSLASGGELSNEDKLYMQDAIDAGLRLKFINIGRVMAGKQFMLGYLKDLIGERRASEVQYVEINAPEAVHASNLPWFIELFSTEIDR